MPNGRIHSAATIGATTGITTSLVIANISLLRLPLLFWLIPIGSLLGLFLTPDLDQDSTVMSHNYTNRFFGRLIGFWWYHLWHSYSISFKHRSPLSHAPIISTLVRLTFLIFPPIIILFRNQRSIRSSKLLYHSLISLVAVLPLWTAALFIYTIGININPVIFIYLIIGLIASDTLHYLMDRIF